MQIQSSHEPFANTIIIKPSTNTAPSIRGELENFLTSADKTDRSKTWAAHRASGFADFLADPEFKAQYEKFAAGKSTDEGVWSKWSAQQRRAFSDLIDPIVKDRLRGHEEAHRQRLAQNDVNSSVQAATGDYQSYGSAFGGFSPRAFNAEEIGRDFERETESGMIDFLKRVDEHEQAGTSGTTWETAFRSRVTTLDHHFNMMRRAYSAHMKDTTEITARYEQVLGELYDYAIERDKLRNAQSAPSP